MPQRSVTTSNRLNAALNFIIDQRYMSALRALPSPMEVQDPRRSINQTVGDLIEARLVSRVGLEHSALMMQRTDGKPATQRRTLTLTDAQSEALDDIARRLAPFTNGHNVSRTVATLIMSAYFDEQIRAGVKFPSI